MKLLLPLVFARVTLISFLCFVFFQISYFARVTSHRHLFGFRKLNRQKMKLRTDASSLRIWPVFLTLNSATALSNYTKLCRFTPLGYRDPWQPDIFKKTLRFSMTVGRKCSKDPLKLCLSFKPIFSFNILSISHIFITFNYLAEELQSCRFFSSWRRNQMTHCKCISVVFFWELELLNLTLSYTFPTCLT